MYEEPRTCVKCHQPMRLVPAGISKKTQQPYAAFYTCDTCKGFKKPDTGGAILADRVQALEEDLKKVKDAIRKRWGLEG